MVGTVFLLAAVTVAFIFGFGLGYGNGRSSGKVDAYEAELGIGQDDGDD